MRPEAQPGDLARQFNSYSGKHLLEQHPEIRELYFWGGGFWNVGYYVGTTGAVSVETVERNIEESKHTRVMRFTPPTVGRGTRAAFRVDTPDFR